MRCISTYLGHKRPLHVLALLQPRLRRVEVFLRQREHTLLPIFILMIRTTTVDMRLYQVWMDLELFLLRLGQPRDLLDGAAGAPAGLWDERRDGGWAVRHR